MNDALQIMTAKTEITWMRKNKYLPLWFMTFNGLQDETPYAGRPAVGNIPELVLLDHIINRYISHPLNFIVS